MSGTDTSTEPPEVGTVDMKLEVVTVPVSDVERAKSFHQSLGRRLEAGLVSEVFHREGGGLLPGPARLPGPEGDD